MMKRTNNKQKGFTLLEILVVMAILGLLIAAVAPNILGRSDDAKITLAKSDLRNISSALDMYKLDNHHYPSTDQGLQALVSRPSGSPEAKNWKQGGYLKKAPQDPWQNEYQYINNGTSYELYSLGADASEGGEGFNGDIYAKDL